MGQVEHNRDSGFAEWLIELRRDLHKNPEVSHKEKKTTAKICSVLDDLNIENNRLPDSFGTIGLINGYNPGLTIGLRADIDALPIQEMNDVSYRSNNMNVMHACGHDANTTIMLGVAKKLCQNQMSKKIHGNVKLLFQPAEEQANGAKHMIQQGVLKNPKVDCVLAGHMAPDLDIGTIGIFKKHGYAAADQFRLTVTGKGGHGGRPHETIDSLVCGAHFVTLMQTIVARNVNPLGSAVISIGKFQSGDIGNVIPERAYIEGTIRTHSSNIRDMIFIRIREIITGMETSFNVKCNFEIIPETPCCNCDMNVSQFMYETAVKILGRKSVKWIPPTMGSEDFAYFTEKKPGSIIRLGCRNKMKKIVSPLHSAYFDIDEDVLEIGVDIFYEAVVSYLS